LHRAGNSEFWRQLNQRNCRGILFALCHRRHLLEERIKGWPRCGSGPLPCGVVVWAVGLSLGGTTGYAINPARDLGPRFAHAVLPIAGKGGSDWGYAGIPVVGPFIGASLAGLVVRMLHF
jgi:glycerol uptake facilitator protein